MRLGIVPQGAAENLEGDFASSLELFDAILKWEHFDKWRGYVKPDVSWNWLMVRHYSEYTYEHLPDEPLRFDYTRKADLEYVEMKIVECWELIQELKRTGKWPAKAEVKS